MKMKKIPRYEAEQRPVTKRAGRSEFGRSTVFVECPFCERQTEAYVWSLAGHGKRCSNPECRAYLGYYVAARDMVPVSVTEK